MATIFSKIAAGEIPSYKCAEDDKFYAFLDINPVKQGHTLVVPRKEIDYIFDMSDEDLAAFEVFAKKVASEPCTHPSHPYRLRGRCRLPQAYQTLRRRDEGYRREDLRRVQETLKS